MGVIPERIQTRARLVAVGGGNDESAGDSSDAIDGEDAGGEGPSDVPPDGPEPPDNIPTPLARLTNDEFINSVVSILDLAEGSALIEQATSGLVSEPDIGGLTSDANNQELTHVAIAGYWNLASAATDAFLDGVTSVPDLETRLGGCTQFKASPGSSTQEEYALRECILSFGTDLMTEAFRRDLQDDEVQSLELLVDQLDDLLVEQSQDLESLASHIVRLRTMIRYILLSPEFLLLVEQGVTDGANDAGFVRRLTSHEIATRMAYFLTGTVPDEVLLADARADRLIDPMVRVEHADRILGTPAGRAQFNRTLKRWLGIDADVSGEDAVATLSTFVDDWYSNDKPFDEFYTSLVDVSHVDGAQTQEPFGVLGLWAFIASHSSAPTPGFITRGVFIVERLLCADLPTDVPADALDAEAATPLEVFESHDKQPCATCHMLFDNYGAALQPFNAETMLYDPGPNELGGNFELWDLGGVSGVADGVADLGAILGGSERAPMCMAELWYRHAIRRSLTNEVEDVAALNALLRDWTDTGDTSMRSLLRTVVGSEGFILLFS